MSKLIDIKPEYIYVTIPAEYICVYHRILAMMADYGEEMLKDCKATCIDKNSGIIECFNMFNSAVAARKLGKTKLAELLIKYIKTKINQIYKGADNSTSFVFPVDETGHLKAYVSCGERPVFNIDEKDMHLYEHKLGNGFIEHFRLGIEDESVDYDGFIKPSDSESSIENPLQVEFNPYYELDETDNKIYHPCAEVVIKYNDKVIDSKYCHIDYYFDELGVHNLRYICLTEEDAGWHNFRIVVTIITDDINETTVVSRDLKFKFV